MHKTSPKWKKINWKQYNQALVQRGSLLIWISEEVRKKWVEKRTKGKGGRPKVFSDLAILTVATLRFVLSLPLRGVEGFVTSLFKLIGSSLPVPDYSLTCKRLKTLNLNSLLKTKKRPYALLIDSSGLKMYGEGEWRALKFGERRKGWLKVHLAVDPETHLIEALKVTSDRVSDCEVLPGLLEGVPRSVKQVLADKGYDTRRCREAIQKRGAEGIIPPRRGAIMSEGDPVYKERDDAIRVCLGLGGDEVAEGLWRKLSGYTRRSLVETAFSRWKRMMGEKVKSRKWENQHAEVYIKQLIMNRLTRLGMPKRGKI